MKWKKHWRYIILEEIKWWSYKMAICKCVCWTVKTVRIAHLNSWAIISCWCYNNEQVKIRSTTHWLRHTKIYRVWSTLIQRCKNPKNASYKDYWWKWITCDPKWEKFEWFWEDMWPSYIEWLTIDRKKNDWNYCKNNCRWATHTVQARNRRNNIKYKWKCISEWCQILFIKDKTVYYRISNGWTHEEALFTPVKKYLCKNSK